MRPEQSNNNKNCFSGNRTLTWPPETVWVWYWAFYAGGRDIDVGRGGTRTGTQGCFARFRCRFVEISIFVKVWTEFIYDILFVGAVLWVWSTSRISRELEALEAGGEEG